MKYFDLEEEYVVDEWESLQMQKINIQEVNDN